MYGLTSIREVLADARMGGSTFDGQSFLQWCKLNRAIIEDINAKYATSFQGVPWNVLGFNMSSDRWSWNQINAFYDESLFPPGNVYIVKNRQANFTEDGRLSTSSSTDEFFILFLTEVDMERLKFPASPAFNELEPRGISVWWVGDDFTSVRKISMRDRLNWVTKYICLTCDSIITLNNPTGG